MTLKERMLYFQCSGVCDDDDKIGVYLLEKAYFSKHAI